MVDTDVQFAEVSKEWGPAASLAVGRQVNVVPGFPLAFEGVAALTHGEDSAGSRWSAGLQIAREIRF